MQLDKEAPLFDVPEELREPIIQTFVLESEETLQEIFVAHQLADHKKVQKLAHKLKGAALSVGGVDLAKMAGSIEKGEHLNQPEMEGLAQLRLATVSLLQLELAPRRF